MKQIIGIITLIVFYIAIFWGMPLLCNHNIKESLKVSLILNAYTITITGLGIFICWCFGLEW